MTVSNIIEKWNKPTADALYAEVQEALEEVAARHGLTVKGHGGTYYEEEGVWKPKIEFHTATSERDTFASLAPQYGLSPDDYGREIREPDGTVIRIDGIRPTARSFPILGVVVESGRRIKMDVNVVKVAFIPALESVTELAPLEWEGQTVDGQVLYARYRHGFIHIGLGDTLEKAKQQTGRVSGKSTLLEVYRVKHGAPDPVISVEKLLELTGLKLVEGGESS
jgi:hypothetical protein